MPYRSLLASDPALITPSEIGAADKFHAAQHFLGGSDAIAPSDIGAAPSAHSHSVDWADLSGVPSAFLPESHAASHHTGGTDAISPGDIGAAASAHSHSVDWADLSGVPSAFSPESHAASHHTGGSDAIAPGDIGAAASAHSHSVDWAELSGKPSAFAPESHAPTHGAGGSDPLSPSDIGAEVSGAAIAAVAAHEAAADPHPQYAGGGGGTPDLHAASHGAGGSDPLAPSDIGAAPASHSHPVAWSEISGKPSTFSPGAHTHGAGDVSSGTLAAARLPEPFASKISIPTSGYGSLKVSGQRSAYVGIQFEENHHVFMIRASDGLSGVYDQSAGSWRWHFTASGVLAGGASVPSTRVSGLEGAIDARFNVLEQSRIACELARKMVSGGGRKYGSSDGEAIRWDARFIALGMGRGSHFSTSGYFNIEMPPVGTAIPGVGGASSTSVDSSGWIPLGVWQCLWYILPIGSTPGSVAANFRIGHYTSDWVVPYYWLPVVWRNGDISPGSGLYQFWCNGAKTGKSSSAT